MGKVMIASENNSVWSADKDDKYGYKSLMVNIFSPDRFSSDPDRVGIAVDLQGHLKKIEWNDIYDLSKIRKRAKDKLGVDLDVTELYSHLMEVFSPEKYRRRGCSAEQVEQYKEICGTLTASRDDINLLESELYDIAKLNVDLWDEPERDETVPVLEVISGAVVKEDGLSKDAEMQSEKVERINNILISLANYAAAKKLADDGKDKNYPVGSKTETRPKTEIVTEVKTKPKPAPVPPPVPAPAPVKPTAPVKPAPKNQGMFRHPFSFGGRIRRAEYWLSLILVCIVISVFGILSNSGLSDSDSFAIPLIFGYIIVLWFLLAQRTKRCHDIGSSGWCQLIPFYEIWLLFDNSEYGENEYGDCPKKMRRN